MVLDDEGMRDEFGTMARWTHDVLRDVSPGAAIPAACRGSGRPGALDWLLDEMGVGAGRRLLDMGAGLGGPAAYARTRTAVDVVCLDPMPAATAAAADVFGMPALVAEGCRLPFATHAFDAAWSLGTLCTTDDKEAWLRELHRVVVRNGPLGLLVVVATDASLSVPWGNDFPSVPELERLVEAAGFGVVARAWTDELPAPDERWLEAERRVDREVRERHRGDETLARVEEREAGMGELVSSGRVRGRLVVARAR
jgi:SAM-dependent methyltransferase